MAKSFDPFSLVLADKDGAASAVRSDAKNADEHETLSALLGEIRRFCGKEVDSAAIDQRGALGQPLLRRIAELGLFGLTIPERHGGAGLSLKAACRAVTELTSYNGSLGTCVGLHSGLALYSLIHLASDELRALYLPEVAEGKRLAAFAATEPEAGSDLASMRTTLTEAADGSLRLSGSKCYVTNGGICGLLTTVARSPGLGGARAGHTVVVLDPTWPGVTRQGEEHKLGLKGSSTITIDYDDVVIPRTHVVGEASRGMEYAHRALTWGRTFMAAGCLGSARAAIAEALTHTSQRVQFGKPLLKFPLVRHALSTATADLYAAESVIRLVCHGFDSGQFDIALPSVAAKIFVSETSWDIVDACLQVMGGVGYIEEAGMARRLRDLRVTRIFEGANDVLRLHLASSTLSWATQDLSAIAGSSGSERLSKALAGVDELVREVLTFVAEVRKKHGFRLFDRQLLQAHLANAVVYAYAAVACALRSANSAASTPSAEEGREAAVAQLAMARLCQRARNSMQTARTIDDDAEKAGADAILAL